MFTQTHCRLFTVKNQTERALWRTLLLSDCTCLSCVWICVHTTFALKAFVCLSLMSTGWGLDAVGSHLCCCVLWFTLSNWWNLSLCVCVYAWVRVCVDLDAQAHPNTSGPAAAAELILAQDVRTPQFPFAWPMRDEGRE